MRSAFISVTPLTSLIAVGTAFEIGPEHEARYVELLTSDYFGGVRPKLALGRGFHNSDHAADSAPVTAISDYWRERFDCSPDVLDRVVEIALRSSSAAVATLHREPKAGSRNHAHTS